MAKQSEKILEEQLIVQPFRIPGYPLIYLRTTCEYTLGIPTDRNDRAVVDTTTVLKHVVKPVSEDTKQSSGC